MKTGFPTMAELLDEFAAGMRQHKDRQAGPQTVSPFLRHPPQSYADFMAGREQKEAST